MNDYQLDLLLELVALQARRREHPNDGSRQRALAYQEKETRKEFLDSFKEDL